MGQVKTLKICFLNPTTAYLVLAVLQLCQVTIDAQGRILPGQGSHGIQVQNTHTNRYNNGLRPPDVPLPGKMPEETSTVSIINQILQDQYIRSPVAVVIDTAPPFLYRAKKLLQTVVSTNTSMAMILIPYNGTGKYVRVSSTVYPIYNDNTSDL